MDVEMVILLLGSLAYRVGWSSVSSLRDSPVKRLCVGWNLGFLHEWPEPFFPPQDRQAGQHGKASAKRGVFPDVGRTFPFPQ